MNTNNFQQQKPMQNQQPEIPLKDVINFGFKFLQWYYSDVHLDRKVRRYRNSKGEFVSNWKGILFK